MNRDSHSSEVLNDSHNVGAVHTLAGTGDLMGICLHTRGKRELKRELEGILSLSWLTEVSNGWSLGNWQFFYVAGVRLDE